MAQQRRPMEGSLSIECNFAATKPIAFGIPRDQLNARIVKLFNGCSLMISSVDI